MKEFGRALRRWRHLRGVKQSHAAELLFVTQPTVSRWERGHHRPTEEEAQRLSHLLEAPLDSAGDAALRRLVESSLLSVHLICDLTHRLLAASQPRFSSWHCAAEELRGASLWRFATDEIRTAESGLADRGWYDEAAPSLTFWTGPNYSKVVAIEPGSLIWERIQLSDGTLARLVTSLSTDRATAASAPS
jgi:transcriptional regulator with XRE-family HTH domain